MLLNRFTSCHLKKETISSQFLNIILILVIKISIMLKNVLIVFVFTFLFFSCKKDYTCECIQTDSDGDSGPPITFVIHDTKNKAETKCENQITIEDLYPEAESSTNCQLK